MEHVFLANDREHFFLKIKRNEVFNMHISRMEVYIEDFLILIF